jgi:hypothetical protein
MNLREWEDPWRLMLAAMPPFWSECSSTRSRCRPASPTSTSWSIIISDSPSALIGAVVSLFAPEVPVWLVFALGGGVWPVTASLFVKLFRRTFGFDQAHVPLFVFMAGSPFVLKNFMHTLGHFDIYGGYGSLLFAGTT